MISVSLCFSQKSCGHGQTVCAGPWHVILHHLGDEQKADVTLLLDILGVIQCYFLPIARLFRETLYIFASMALIVILVGSVARR